MTTARRGNPGYLEANVSSTMPVPLLMTMAPKSGVQPCDMRSLTKLFPRTTTAHATAEDMTSIAMIRGNAVLIQFINTELMAPRRDKVTRSPRKDATGGAMLSEEVRSD